MTKKSALSASKKRVSYARHSPLRKGNVEAPSSAPVCVILIIEISIDGVGFGQVSQRVPGRVLESCDMHVETRIEAASAYESHTEIRSHH